MLQGAEHIWGEMKKGRNCMGKEEREGQEIDVHSICSLTPQQWKVCVQQKWSRTADFLMIGVQQAHSGLNAAFCACM